MAESSDLFLLPLQDVKESEQQHSPNETLAPAPFWSSSDSGSGSGSEYLCEEDPPTVSLDLFNRPQTIDPFGEAYDSSDFRVLERDEEMDSDYLGLGLGLGLGFQNQEEDGGGGNQENFQDWGGDEFFIGRRSSGSESNEFSRAHPIDQDGLRIVGFESDSDSDEQIIAIGENSDGNEVQDRVTDEMNLPLCWDCLRIDEDRRETNEEFEWEEVDGRIEEREVLSMMAIADEEYNSDIIQELEHQEEDMARNIEWEVLLTVSHLGNPSEDAESYFVEDHEGFVYTSEYDEVLFGQFQEHDSSFKGTPPAAKSVVENLPSVVLTKEDVANNNANCAVCKDEIFIEEKVKRLPCSHYYHEECIFSWLGIRNTCPLCRYELPTDDPEYENRKASRAGNGGSEEESRVRYDFEMLPEA